MKRTFIRSDRRFLGGSLRNGLFFLLSSLTGLFCLSATSAWADSPAQAMKRLPEAFDIRTAPSKADWQSFLKASSANRNELWAYQSSKGAQLKDWAWGWRLGWVRACANGKDAPCDGILNASVSDKALVVRAEGVATLGRLYDGSENERITGLLLNAYRDPRNFRQGKPLFIQSRILFAISRIGGAKALAAAAELAKKESSMQKYWSQLEKADHIGKG